VARDLDPDCERMASVRELVVHRRLASNSGDEDGLPTIRRGDHESGLPGRMIQNVDDHPHSR
jgi:hypothetical protein